LAGRLRGKGVFVAAAMTTRGDSSAGKDVVELPATSVRANRVRIERDRFPGALDGLGDRGRRVGSTGNGRARDEHGP